MKKTFALLFLNIVLMVSAQMDADLVPDLIPKIMGQKYGYVNRNSKPVIQPEYQIAMFFSEDCNLLNSANKNAKIYGSAYYATVEKNGILYRINKKGKRVYQYKNSDLGRCVMPYEISRFKAYRLNGAYGLVSKKDIDMGGYKDFDIYPQYQMLFVLESDRENPMIVAVKNDKFGIVDRQNRVVIPFIYSDIKSNLSWQTAHLFEVSLDGNHYFYIDKNNKAY